MTRIPELQGTLDLANQPLTPAERYVLMLVDGRASTEDIAAASAMPASEAEAALDGLAARGVLRFREELGKVAVGRMTIQKIALGPVTTVVDDDVSVLLARAREARSKGDLVTAREQCNLAWMADAAHPEVNRLRAELEALEKAAAPVATPKPAAAPEGPAIPDAGIAKTPKARPLLLQAIKKTEAKDYEGAYRDLAMAVMLEAGNARLAQFRDDVDKARKKK